MHMVIFIITKPIRSIIRNVGRNVGNTARGIGSEVRDAAGGALADRAVDRLFPEPGDPDYPDGIDAELAGGHPNEDKPTPNSELIPPGIDRKGYPHALGAKEPYATIRPSEITGPNRDQPLGNPATGGDLNSAPNNAPNMEYSQTIADVERHVHTATFIEARRPTNKINPTKVAVNYDIETLKSWLGREHRLGNFSGNIIDHALGVPLLRQVARGRLAHFSWISADTVFTIRWNAPKNVFGAFQVRYEPGTASIGPARYDVLNSRSLYKAIVDIQGNVFEFKCPFVYIRPFMNLTYQSTWGNFRVEQFADIAPRSATDTSWTWNCDIYVSFKNVSLLTPTVFAIPQGIVLGKVIGAIVAGGISNIGNTGGHYGTGSNDPDNPSYTPSGQDVIRTFSEAINLCRADGLDPAMPMNREVCAIAPIGHPHGVTAITQLLEIPYYRTLAFTGNTAKLVLEGGDSWFTEVRDAVAALRCDFIVTLNCFATGFHSGRVRIIYNPTNTAVALPADPLARSWAPSILWNIEENKSITFDVPYGAALEYDRFPIVWVVVEVPFSNSFGVVTAPIFLATITPTNVATIGYGDKFPIVSRGWFAESTFVQFPNTAEAPIVSQGATFNVAGWYNQQHTSENEFNYCLKTLFRRPARGSVPCFGPTNFAISDMRYLTRQAPPSTNTHYGRFMSYGGRIMSAFCGWRGTIKFSISTDQENTFTVVMRYHSFTSNPLGDTNGTIISSDGFIEVSIPYFTRNLMYSLQGRTADTSTFSLGEGPWLFIEPTDMTASYEVYISFMDDLELVGLGRSYIPGDFSVRTVPPEAQDPTLDTNSPFAVGSDDPNLSDLGLTGADSTLDSVS